MKAERVVVFFDYSLIYDGMFFEFSKCTSFNRHISSRK